MKIGAWLLSCEHGGKRVPPAYRGLFDSAAARAALAGHRGYDIGALAVARSLARRLDMRLFSHEVTRLLIDANRSIGHPRLFSEFTAGLDAGARRTVIERYYLPHRKRIEQAVAASAGRPVCHIGVHSFAGTRGGERRRADVALLYDPARPLERTLCREWKRALHEAAPALRLRRNYPYRGAADGLTTALRRRFSPTRYVGIELEVNQALLAHAAARREIVNAIANSLLRLGARPS